jgi:ribosomal protein L34
VVRSVCRSSARATRFRAPVAGARVKTTPAPTKWIQNRAAASSEVVRAAAPKVSRLLPHQKSADKDDSHERADQGEWHPQVYAPRECQLVTNAPTARATPFQWMHLPAASRTRPEVSTGSIQFSRGNLTGAPCPLPQVQSQPQACQEKAYCRHPDSLGAPVPSDREEKQPSPQGCERKGMTPATREGFRARISSQEGAKVVVRHRLAHRMRLSLPRSGRPNTGDKLRSGARVQPSRRGHEAACPCWQPCRRKPRQLH